MKPRRRSKGVLRTLAKPAHKPPRRKKPRRSPLRRALLWVGGIAAGAAGLALMLAFVSFVYDPALEAREGEAEVVVAEIQGRPDAAGPDVVAAARVTIESRQVLVPLTAGDRASVEAGTRLRVRYTVFRSTGFVRVEEWRIAP